MCISVYHILFAFIQAEFITVCLQSNANTKCIRASGFYCMIYGVMTNLKRKAPCPVLSFFLFFWFFCLLPGLPNWELQCHVFGAAAMPSWTASHSWGPDTSCSALALICEDAAQLRAMAVVPQHCSDAAPLLSNQSWCTSSVSKNQSMCISHAVSSLPTFPLPMGLGKAWSLLGHQWSTSTGDLGIGWASVCCCNTNIGKWYTQKLC